MGSCAREAAKAAAWRCSPAVRDRRLQLPRDERRRRRAPGRLRRLLHHPRPPGPPGPRRTDRRLRRPRRRRLRARRKAGPNARAKPARPGPRAPQRTDPRLLGLLTAPATSKNPAKKQRCPKGKVKRKEPLRQEATTKHKRHHRRKHSHHGKKGAQPMKRRPASPSPPSPRSRWRSSPRPPRRPPSGSSPAGIGRRPNQDGTPTAQAGSHPYHLGHQLRASARPQRGNRRRRSART